MSKDASSPNGLTEAVAHYLIDLRQGNKNDSSKNLSINEQNCSLSINEVNKDSGHSSDDNVITTIDANTLLNNDDLIFEDDEDTNSIQEDPQDKYLPATDHYRRVILHSSS